METKPEKIPTTRRLKDLEYPVMFGVFAITVFVLFIAAAQFLSENIDSAISSPDETQIQAQLTHINTEGYNRVGEKLHLPAIDLSLTEEGAVQPTGTTTVQGSISPAVEEIKSAELKSAFSIAIYNSTKKAGLANTVKTDLASAGFTVTKTGNKTPQEPQTTVQIRERVQASPAILDEVLSIVGQRFTIGDPQILEGESPYDIVITLGAQ